ncbi:MAG: hypothetical protein WKG07_22800 [Hymenobacter sp.]
MHLPEGLRQFRQRLLSKLNDRDRWLDSMANALLSKSLADFSDADELAVSGQVSSRPCMSLDNFCDPTETEKQHEFNAEAKTSSASAWLLASRKTLIIRRGPSRPLIPPMPRWKLEIRGRLTPDKSQSNRVILGPTDKNNYPMKNKPLRHVLGISGGKDSAALAIYLRQRHPELEMDYYFCVTRARSCRKPTPSSATWKTTWGRDNPPERGNGGRQPQKVVRPLRGGVRRLPALVERPVVHQKLKLEPFERYVGTDPVVSYVGIRGDEDREGYISRKPNIQSIFPFRRNIWSEDVVQRVLQASRPYPACTACMPN